MMSQAISAGLECIPKEDENMIKLIAKAFLYAEGDAKIALARALLQFLN
jgi:hypothetical protein